MLKRWVTQQPPRPLSAAATHHNTGTCLLTEHLQEETPPGDDAARKSRMYNIDLRHQHRNEGTVTNKSRVNIMSSVYFQTVNFETFVDRTKHSCTLFQIHCLRVTWDQEAPLMFFLCILSLLIPVSMIIDSPFFTLHVLLISSTR